MSLGEPCINSSRAISPDQWTNQKASRWRFSIRSNQRASRCCDIDGPAAVVAEAESFLYSNGVFCYLSNGLLKIRDLQNSALEDTISIGKLLEIKNHFPGTIKDKHFKLRILNYADGFVFYYFNPGNRLFPRFLIISLSHGRLFNYILASSRKIFVRNNDKYFYYGIYNAIARDGN